MFDLRSMWIPTYFKDVLLPGILRTTSRSESENSFYGNFLNPSISLVKFWMRFYSTLQAQGHKELLADNSSLHSMSKLMLNRGLEWHASNVYTHENFYMFQRELWAACLDCGVEDKKEENGVEILHLIENSDVNVQIALAKCLRLKEYFVDADGIKPQVHGSTEVVKIEYRSDRELFNSINFS
ncbi:hypothetical protein MTR_8g465780 [Medicago truncatula]|uniref:Protein FAR1-RELATED SEQUENCE n=1 Tax=Medicago truncatula TaxID=3880 RepID=A0A072TQ61_MEDTR|nr:hypothetical protein MTR_8g465780 [Medicago truncatula]